jgi:hypothetical protein
MAAPLPGGLAGWWLSVDIGLFGEVVRRRRSHRGADVSGFLGRHPDANQDVVHAGLVSAGALKTIVRIHRSVLDEVCNLLDAESHRRDRAEVSPRDAPRSAAGKG